MKKVLLTIFLLTLSNLALGFEETFHVEDDLPYWTIISQLANLGLLVSILVFTQRKAVAQTFKDRKESYLASVEAASQSKKEAEDKLKDITTRLESMKATYEKQISEAKKNAEEAYKIQVTDARNNAEKMKSLALNTIEFEVQKQIENLRVETFQKSAGMAEKKLEASMTPDQLKAWNSQFSSQGAH